MSLAHRIEGPADAPVLVMSSSIGTTMALWDVQLPELLPRTRVLRYDHPGHGASPVEQGPLTIEGMAHEVLALLDALGFERVSFCGLSLGGMVGMALALEAPTRVERLVLACTSAYLGPPEPWEARARTVRERGLEAIADSVVERWFTAGFRSDHPESADRFRRMLVATPPEGYAACCDAIARWDARGRIHAIATPTLVVAGQEDPATTTEHTLLITREIRGSRTTTLAGAAHLANVEQPVLFSRALLGHLGVSSRSHEAA